MYTETYSDLGSSVEVKIYPDGQCKFNGVHYSSLADAKKEHCPKAYSYLNSYLIACAIMAYEERNQIN